MIREEWSEDSEASEDSENSEGSEDSDGSDHSDQSPKSPKNLPNSTSFSQKLYVDGISPPSAFFVPYLCSVIRNDRHGAAVFEQIISTTTHYQE
jgi:hypothetical protein